MIEDYLIVANRVRQELGELERVVARTERAIEAARRRSEDQGSLYRLGRIESPRFLCRFGANISPNNNNR